MYIRLPLCWCCCLRTHEKAVDFMASDFVATALRGPWQGQRSNGRWSSLCRGRSVHLCQDTASSLKGHTPDLTCLSSEPRIDRARPAAMRPCRVGCVFMCEEDDDDSNDPTPQVRFSFTHFPRDTYLYELTWARDSSSRRRLGISSEFCKKCRCDAQRSDAMGETSSMEAKANDKSNQ